MSRGLDSPLRFKRKPILISQNGFLARPYQSLRTIIAKPIGIDNNILLQKEFPLPLCRDPQAPFQAVLSTFLFSEESPTEKIKLNYIIGLGRQMFG